MTKLSFLKNIAVLFFAVWISGLISVYLGKEISWDVANYHYYDPYALFHKRWLIDYWPTSYPHVRLVPTLDILVYFLINTLSSMHVMFVMGAIHGLNFWLLFLLAYFFLSSQKNKYALSFSLLLAALGIYGPTAYTGMGSFQNDNLISIFVLAFILLQLNVLRLYESHHRLAYGLIFIGGLLLGFGTGLKFTACTFVVGALLMFILMPGLWVDRLKRLIIYSIGVGIGFGLSAGYWFWMLYQQYDHSIMLLFNSLFYASADSSAFRFSSEFLPHGIIEAVFFPFYFSFNGNIGTPFKDFRFIALYVLLVLVGVIALTKQFFIKKNNAVSYSEVWLFGFVILSYIVWEYFFSILRYIVAIEMLVPLMIYLLMQKIIKNKKLCFGFFSLIICFIVITMQPAQLMRMRWYESGFFNVKLPLSVKQSSEAMVLMAYPAYALSLEPKPQTYLIPFFPAQWRFVGVPFFKGRFFHEMNEHAKIQKVINGYSGHFYLLTTDAMLPELYETAKTFGLMFNGDCGVIVSDRQKVSNHDVFLCPVKKS